MAKTARSESVSDVLTVKEAAAFLRCDPKTIYEAIAKRQFPGRRVGKRIVIYRAALLAWLHGEESVQTEGS
ncbi:MAG: helix-turn-helix domain-containing protein [Deltaproteobacteria bacterium]|nr:helix-turn-helix domain-containing protein [Deltaproteobacteria bacterium]